MRLIHYMTLLLFWTISHHSLGQDTLSRKERRKLRPAYWEFGGALNTITLQDLATSPNTYRGIFLGAHSGFQKEDWQKKFRTSLNLAQGKIYFDSPPDRYYWKCYMLYFKVSQHWNIPELTSRKLNTKVGYAAHTFLMVRTNPDLFNAGLGLDHFTTAGPSISVNLHFERKQGFEKKIWFVTVRGKPRKFKLAYQLDLPLITIKATPPYSYVGNFLDRETSTIEEYSWDIRGLMFSSDLALFYFLKNGNAFRLQYCWQGMIDRKGETIRIGRETLGIYFFFRINPIGRHEKF